MTTNVITPAAINQIIQRQEQHAQELRQQTMQTLQQLSQLQLNPQLAPQFPAQPTRPSQVQSELVRAEQRLQHLGERRNAAAPNAPVSSTSAPRQVVAQQVQPAPASKSSSKHSKHPV